MITRALSAGHTDHLGPVKHLRPVTQCHPGRTELGRTSVRPMKTSRDTNTLTSQTVVEAMALPPPSLTLMLAAILSTRTGNQYRGGVSSHPSFPGPPAPPLGQSAPFEGPSIGCANRYRPCLSSLPNTHNPRSQSLGITRRILPYPI